MKCHFISVCLNKIVSRQINKVIKSCKHFFVTSEGTSFWVCLIIPGGTPELSRVQNLLDVAAISAGLCQSKSGTDLQLGGSQMKLLFHGAQAVSGVTQQPLL